MRGVSAFCFQRTQMKKNGGGVEGGGLEVIFVRESKFARSKQQFGGVGEVGGGLLDVLST